MMQRFVEHDPEEHYFTLLEEHADVFRRMAVFDVVINNTDRKGGHCLRGARRPGGSSGIDHGVTFHAQWKLRTVIWDFGGESIPPDVCGDLHRFAEQLRVGRRERTPRRPARPLRARRAARPHGTPLGDRRAPRSRRRLPLLSLADDLDRRHTAARVAPLVVKSQGRRVLSVVWLRCRPRSMA